MRTILAAAILMVAGIAYGAPPVIAVNGMSFVCKPVGGNVYQGTYRDSVRDCSATLKFTPQAGGLLIVEFAQGFADIRGWSYTAGGAPYSVKLYDMSNNAGGKFWGTATITP